MAQAGACACRLTAALLYAHTLVWCRPNSSTAVRAGGALSWKSKWSYGELETCEEFAKKNLAAAASGGIRHLTLSSQSMLYEIKIYIP